MSNQAIIKNLEVLLAAVEAQPEELFGLNNFRKVEPCGTIYCVAGLAASMPYFQALGMDWDLNDPTVMGTSVWSGGGDGLFGDNSMGELFQYAGGGWLDDDLGWDDMDKEKELAIARLEYRIKEYKDANEGK